MTPEMVLAEGQDALYLTFLLASPLLVTALVVGLAVGMFQAATQINEMTLSFIPKLFAMAAALGLTGPWLLSMLMDFTTELYTSIPVMLGLIQ